MQLEVKAFNVAGNSAYTGRLVLYVQRDCGSFEVLLASSPIDGMCQSGTTTSASYPLSAPNAASNTYRFTLSRSSLEPAFLDLTETGMVGAVPVHFFVETSDGRYSSFLLAKENLAYHKQTNNNAILRAQADVLESQLGFTPVILADVGRLTAPCLDQGDVTIELCPALAMLANLHPGSTPQADDALTNGGFEGATEHRTSPYEGDYGNGFFTYEAATPTGATVHSGAQSVAFLQSSPRGSVITAALQGVRLADIESITYHLYRQDSPMSPGTLIHSNHYISLDRDGDRIPGGCIASSEIEVLAGGWQTLTWTRDSLYDVSKWGNCEGEDEPIPTSWAGGQGSVPTRTLEQIQQEAGDFFVMSATIQVYENDPRVLPPRPLVFGDDFSLALVPAEGAAPVTDLNDGHSVFINPIDGQVVPVADPTGSVPTNSYDSPVFVPAAADGAYHFWVYADDLPAPDEFDQIPEVSSAADAAAAILPQGADVPPTDNEDVDAAASDVEEINPQATARSAAQAQQVPARDTSRKTLFGDGPSSFYLYDATSLSGLGPDSASDPRRALQPIWGCSGDPGFPACDAYLDGNGNLAVPATEVVATGPVVAWAFIDVDPSQGPVGEAGTNSAMGYFSAVKNQVEGYAVADALDYHMTPMILGPTPADEATDGFVTRITPQRAQATPLVTTMTPDSLGNYFFVVEAFDGAGADYPFTEWRAEIVAMPADPASALGAQNPTWAPVVYSVGSYGGEGNLVERVPAATNDGDSTLTFKVPAGKLRNPVDGTQPNIVAVQFFVPYGTTGRSSSYSEAVNTLLGDEPTAQNASLADTVDLLPTPILLKAPAVPTLPALPCDAEAALTCVPGLPSVPVACSPAGLPGNAQACVESFACDDVPDVDEMPCYPTPAWIISQLTPVPGGAFSPFPLTSRPFSLVGGA